MIPSGSIPMLWVLWVVGSLLAGVACCWVMGLLFGRARKGSR